MKWWIATREKIHIGQYKLRNCMTPFTREAKYLFRKRAKTVWVWDLSNKIMPLNRACKCFWLTGTSETGRSMLIGRLIHLTIHKSSNVPKSKRKKRVFLNKLSIWRLLANPFKDHHVGFPLTVKMGDKSNKRA